MNVTTDGLKKDKGFIIVRFGSNLCPMVEPVETLFIKTLGGVFYIQLRLWAATLQGN